MSVAPVVVLETKLRPPPIRADAVPRPRLASRLDRALECPLTVVSAPAGSGKTTLVADWCDSLDPEHVAVAWLSLDAADDDPPRFARYLVEAVHRAGLDLGEMAARARTDPAVSLDSVMAALVNEAAASPTAAVLVLDDHHVLGEAVIHGAIQLLVDHAPAGLHLVISTRSEPPLALSRLRARGQLNELRGPDLRFNAEESQGLLARVVDREIGPDEAQRLERQTEGWAAGLQLAALSLREQPEQPARAPSRTSHRYSFEYLAEEVFRTLDEPTREFLVRTSILERLIGELCDAVTGQTGGAARLAHLYRHNLFTIALDDVGEWFRYHHLFRDFLRQGLVTLVPGEVAAAHRAAGAWLSEHGYIDDAIEHAALDEDADTAINLIERALPFAVSRTDFVAVERWLRAIPEAEVSRRPGIGIPWARKLIVLGRVKEAQSLLEEAEEGLARADAGAGLDLVRLRALSAITASWLHRYQGRLDAAQEVCEGILATLPPDRRLERAWLRQTIGLVRYERDAGDAVVEALPELADECLATNSPAGYAALRSTFAGHRLLQGRLREAEGEAAAGLARLHEHGDVLAPAALHTTIARVFYERDDLDRAEMHARASLATNNAISYTGTATPPDIVLTQLHIARGARGEAKETLDRLEQRLRSTDMPLERFAAGIARLRLALGDQATAQRWARSCGLSVTDEPTWLSEFEHLVFARVIATGDSPADALSLLDRLRASAAAGGRQGRVMEMRVIEALARSRSGDPAGALDALVDALALGGPAGYVRAFLDTGPDIVPLLRQATALGRWAGFASMLLERFDAPAQPADETQGESLSAREIEVLRLLATGLSNNEIADRLVVSLATVKTHVRNVYAKLDVHGRTRAVAAARERGLL